MTKVQSTDPGLPSRSDSFLRMLELEKLYKMQRIQGHAPATIIAPSTSSPSAQPNIPFKARRVSGHPPLSHQTQIMKAVRRSSALPLLSISIPPSPTDGPTVGTNGLPEELQQKEERTKTVTFSGPEEDDDGDSSDQSSICQSPSWEQYGRKKKKKPKKRDVEQAKKSKEDKPASNLKKKGNKLSKVPPAHVQGVESLTADRSQSALELDLFRKSDAARLDSPDPTLPEAMANSKAGGKPKSKGFLSSFRLQHGNVAAVQKMIETQRISSDGNSPASSPMLRPHPAVSVVDPNFVNPRKPPSIRSAISNSTRSISSLDQLPPTARHSPSSSHGRSQSLLTSTLSKLKGPSYLYYRPTEVTDSAQYQRPSSSHEPDITSRWSNDEPESRPEDRAERPRERPMTSNEATQQLPEFTFPPKSRRVATQPTPNIVARNVHDQAHLQESRDFSNGYRSPEPTSFRSRRTQVPPRAPGRESAAEKEQRPRSERVPRAPRQPVELWRDAENRPLRVEQSGGDFERQNYIGRQINGYVQPRVESWIESEHDSRPISGQSDANLDNERFVEHGVSLSKEEDDQVSVGTLASTIRPLSRRQNQNSPETNGRKHVTFPPSPSAIGRAVTSDTVDEVEEIIVEPSQPERLVEREEIISTEKPIRSDRSADYFSFISQSYAPPSLELRSPLDGKFPSPRIDEEPEEEDDLDHILRHIPVRSELREAISPSDMANQFMNATSKIAGQRPPKDSPSMSSHYSENDIPAFERLGLSPQAARVLVGVETSSTSTSPSNTDPSRTNSERSSSSTCDDTPPSPSTAPTPDSSHPQSDKELALPHMDITASAAARSSVDNDERTPRMSYRPPVMEPPAKHSSRSVSRDANFRDDSWSRTALPINLDNHPDAGSNKLNGITQSPPLIASPSSVAFASEVKESHEEEHINGNPYRQPLPPRAQSALDLNYTNFLPDMRQHPPYSKKAKSGVSSVSLPNSPPPELADVAPRKSALRMSRKNSSNNEESSALVSQGAAYLQEARKAAPIPPVPASRALRPHYAHKNSSNSVRGTVASPETRSDPIAKMLVECCNCKFFHDMPSRVYECMAKPDSLVEDKLLGVSATITTMVKCPWCAHGMTTQCCSGYAAVVYLKEKLHGKL
ncbi:hypothetical protein F4677DRAFT_454976 [Hypoxylon crocopeplum]|nr:hypothetical protein F4677DRAFT_454976 [Hypoxylon crocopeplum]